VVRLDIKIYNANTSVGSCSALGKWKISSSAIADRPHDACVTSICKIVFLSYPFEGFRGNLSDLSLGHRKGPVLILLITELCH